MGKKSKFHDMQKFMFAMAQLLHTNWPRTKKETKKSKIIDSITAEISSMDFYIAKQLEKIAYFL